MDTKPVQIKLRISKEGSNHTLDVEKANPKIHFKYKYPDVGLMTEKSGIVKRNGTKFVKKDVILANYNGKTLIKVPKGQSAMSLNKKFEMSQTKYIAVLTKERTLFTFWKVTSGEIMNFPTGQTLIDFII